MDLSDYQRAALETDVRPERALEDTMIHLLGLAGEAGSVAEEYKKFLRDGSAYAPWRERMNEELGDVLWYLAAIADRLELDLGEIAEANLAKTRARWIPSPLAAFDTAFDPGERLPRFGTYEFRALTREDAVPTVDLFLDGQGIGNQLTDASDKPDGYRFHDVFHIAYATFLGWSPVTRKLLGRKRRSDAAVDENQDGGRAIVIEEGIAALAFGYAADLKFLDGIEHVDQSLLRAIKSVTASLEVAARNPADWERAIVNGFRVFRDLAANDGGFVQFNADTELFEFRLNAPQ